MATHAQTVIAQGTLGRRPLPRLLHFLLGQQVTGRLEVDAGAAQARVFLRQGLPVHVERPDASDRLDQVIVEAGALSRQQLVALESVRCKSGRRLGDLLRGTGLLDRGRLSEMLKLQLQRRIARLFEPRDGQFTVYLAEHAFGLGDEFQDVTVHPRDLVLPGLRASYDRARLDRELRGLYGLSFRLRRVAPSTLEGMGFVSSDGALLRALAQGPLRLQDLDRMEGPVEDVRAGVLALLYCDLLALHQDGPLPAEVSPPAGHKRVVTPPPTLMPLGPAPPRPAPPPPTPAPVRLEPAHAARIALADRLPHLTHFEVLGAEPGASAQAVDVAYLDMVRRHHPDRLGPQAQAAVRDAANRILARAAEAHQILRDPAKRLAYEHSLTDSGDESRQALALMEAELLFQAGEKCLRHGDFAGAILAFSGAGQRNPREPQHPALLAWCRFADPGADKEALAPATLKVLRRAVFDNPRFARGYYFLGMVHKHAGELDRARRCFGKALEVDERHLDSMREMRLIDMRARRG